MFLIAPRSSPKLSSFPRICGDVPSTGLRVFSRIPFSPHTRGCSANQPAYRFGSGVFPAYAGMFLPLRCSKPLRFGFPRIRGDVPKHIPQVYCPVLVFPAYAGMFLMWILGVGVWGCFPRIRGDVPAFEGILAAVSQFSPHTRGCSYDSSSSCSRCMVFPAYAGMFRRLKPLYASKNGFPRIRGDVPEFGSISPGQGGFSPHTRGCSVECDHDKIWLKVFPHTRGCSEFTSGGSWVRTVFPAYAGMFPTIRLGLVVALGFPRIRGDVPE